MTGARVASKSADPAWEVTVVPDGLGEVTIEVPVRACTEANAVCIGGRSLSRAVETTVPGTPMTMTARFTQTPSAHDGSNGFELHMEFSHEPENFSYRTVQGALFDIEGGRIERVWRRERGKDRQWGMVVAPDGGGAVTLVARATTDCAAQNAVCDAEGRKFAGGLTATIPGPEPSGQAQVADPITASWSKKPDEHDGASQFDLHLDFSRAPANFSYRAIAGGVVSVQGGRISRVWRRVRGQDDQWGVQVTPSGTDDVTVSVNGTTDCAAQHAVCTADGGMLEGGAQAVIPGPAGLSVANARVEEERGATLDFVISLSRSRNEVTTVEYATSDGTARAGEDYTATAGTLTFAANATSRTVSVTVLDDDHDEGEETLTLRLSNPSGARVADAGAWASMPGRPPARCSRR